MLPIIHQQIEKGISDYLASFKGDYIDQGFEFTIEGDWWGDDVYKIEVTGYHKDDYQPDRQTRFVLLRLFINHQYHQVQISNIFLPTFMKHRGLGKKLIYKVFVISEQEQYELFIVDMVNSFYQKMIARGALPCNGCDDAVQVVRGTKLL